MIARQGLFIWFQFNCTNACHFSSCACSYLLFNESQCSLTCPVYHLDQIGSS